jgi:hypothetical protein
LSDVHRQIVQRAPDAIEGHRTCAFSIRVAVVHLAPQEIKHLANAETVFGLSVKYLDVKCPFDLDHHLDRVEFIVQSQRFQHASTSRAKIHDNKVHDNDVSNVHHDRKHAALR